MVSIYFKASPGISTVCNLGHNLARQQPPCGLCNPGQFHEHTVPQFPGPWNRTNDSKINSEFSEPACFARGTIPSPLGRINSFNLPASLGGRPFPLHAFVIVHHH